MMHNKFFIHNGEIMKREEFTYDFNSFMNTPFGIYCDIRLVNTYPLFLNDHLILLEEQLKQLHLSIPRKLSLEKLKTYITRLLNINKVYKGAYVRILLLQNKHSNIPDFFIYNESLEHTYYTLRDKGLHTDIFKENTKKTGEFAGIKHNIDLLQTLGQNFCREKKIDSCFLLNEYGFLCETSQGNLFLVKDMNIYTPPLTDGCKQEVIREKLIELAMKNDFTIFDESSISKNEILSADEVFIASDIFGIEWVQRYKNKRFYNKVARSLLLLLNQHILKLESGK